MHRRDFLSGAAAALGLASAAGGRAFAQSALPDWSVVDLTTRIDPAPGDGALKIWAPVPSIETSWQRSLDTSWSGNGKFKLIPGGPFGATMLEGSWDAGEPAPYLEIKSRVAIRDRVTGDAAPLSEAERARYTAPTALIPTDGIVRDTAEDITRSSRSDFEKATALYQWIVDNTYRDPATPGCGVGDVKAMLERKALGGKCADINALFVALARSIGLPARDAYGVRVLKSRFGYVSLGAKSADVTHAQHCRAEIHFADRGWVAMDPADVRKVVLEERSKPTTLADPLVVAARERLLGSWEGNWVGYNFAHDVTPPGEARGLPFLMYPQGRRGGTMIDCLDSDKFKYSLEALAV